MFGEEEVRVNQTTLRSYNHTMYTIKQRKCALSVIDNTRNILLKKKEKETRYILPDLVTTRALGHYINQPELDCDIEFV